MPSTTSATDQTTRGFAAQLPRNLAANIAYFLVNIVIGILLVPYFIDTLGVAAYGLIPLATSITGYVAIVVQSLNTAVTRFLTVDLQRGDYAAANKTFNTSLFGLTAVILVVAFLPRRSLMFRESSGIGVIKYEISAISSTNRAKLHELVFFCRHTGMQEGSRGVLGYCVYPKDSTFIERHYRKLKWY